MNRQPTDIKILPDSVLIEELKRRGVEYDKADIVIKKIWAYLGPKKPPCCDCQGCSYEWEKSLEVIVEYLGSDKYPVRISSNTVPTRPLLSAGLIEEFDKRRAFLHNRTD